MDEQITCRGDGRRLDVLLAEFSGLTRSRVAALIEAGQALVNGRPEKKPAARPAVQDEVSLLVPPPREAEPQPQDIPIHIYYEDADLAVVEKPAGLVVHPAAGNEDGTLVTALLYHLDQLRGIGWVARPGIVHLLDKDTSGLLLVAKNDVSQLALSNQLQRREVEKHYLALVEGVPREESGRIELPIGRSKKDRKKMAPLPVAEGGREAVTLWRTLRAGNGCALLDVHILTGRTHQIRVHMRETHHPVCGDPIYGYPKGLRVPRLMLHAHSLRLRHPTTGEELFFVSPPPPAFVQGCRAGGIEDVEGMEG